MVFKKEVLTRYLLAALLLMVSLGLSTANVFANENGNTSTSTGNAGCENMDGNSSCTDAVQFSDVGSAGSSNLPSDNVGNPINLMSGNKFQQETDFALPGASLMLNRMFNSANADNNIGLGQGWHHSYAVSLYDAGNGARDIVQSTGSRLHFKADGEDDQGQPLMRGDATHTGYVVQTDTHHEWHLPDGRTLVFQGSFLVRIDWPDQRRLELFYRANRLHSVTDETGRVLRFEYHAGVSRLTGYDENRFGVQAGHLANVTLPDGSIIEYDYDHNRNLSRVRYEDGTSREYHYENAIYPNVLTGITDRLGVRFASWTYDDQGRANSSEHAGGVERVTLEFPDAQAVAEGQVVQTLIANSLGHTSTYTWQQLNASVAPRLLSSEGAGCATCPETGYEYTYDAHGRLLTSTKNGQGNAVGLGGISYQYEDLGRIARITRTDSLGQEHLVHRYDYDNSDAPSKISRPSVKPGSFYETDIQYNDDKLITKITERGFSPVNEHRSSFDAIERTTTLSYENSLLRSIDGPRTDVEDITHFSYDMMNRLTRIDTSTGRRMEIKKYDIQGRPTEFQIGNRDPLKLSYDANSNLVEAKMRLETIRYEYDAESKLTAMVDPWGKRQSFGYDEARRMTRATDEMGLSINYLNDSEGRLTERSLFGLNGSLVKSINYAFDAENRLQASNEQSSNQSTGSTLFIENSLKYDELNRLVSISGRDGDSLELEYDDNSVINSVRESGVLQSEFEFDVSGRTTAQVDARGNRTKTVYDDFGRVVALDSPDSGITLYEYDLASNRTRLENAAGEVTDYEWDIGNRLVRTTSIDGVTTYKYHPMNGRLVETTNPDTSETFEYDGQARLIKHTRLLGGDSYSTVVGYNSRGQVDRKKLPDGQTLRYHYHQDGVNAGTLRAITREQLLGLSQDTLVGEIDLEARDGQTGYLSHNGVRTQREFHADGSIK